MIISVDAEKTPGKIQHIFMIKSAQQHRKKKEIST